MADQLSEEQIAEFKEAFALFDKDGDGFISVSELVTVMRSIGQNPTEAELQGMLEILNGKDGKISFPDFLNFVNQTIKVQNEDDELRDLFRIFDRSNKGYLTPADLRLGFTNMGEHLTDEEIDELIRDVDEDGDGQLNYEQFLKLFEAL